jgi:glycosyltransferase involved in cell wall biosynthesis
MRMEGEACALRLAIVNPVWDAALSGAEETLRRFHSLTGWAASVAATGATITVHQRFSSSITLEHHGLTYAFVSDGGAPAPSRPWNDAQAIAASVLACRPDVVHVNGVIFPEWLRALRRALPPEIRMVVQDHGGWDPMRAPVWSRWRIRQGLAASDAVLVSSPGQAAQWQTARVVPPRVTISDVMEASTELRPMARAEGVRISGVLGDPAVLWVGRLIPNKDPVTMIEGFARFVSVQPGALLTMVFNSGTMRHEVQQRIERDPWLAARVRLVGDVPANLMPAYYSAADIYVSASHHEGSGYAAIEAMACGAVPVLTDIPSFRALTGDGRVGALWRAGQPQALCDALASVAASSREAMRAQVTSQFNTALSWDVIGRRAAGIYREVRDR